MKLLASQARQLELLWWLKEAVRVRQVQQRRVLRRMLVDQQRHRLQLHRMPVRMATIGIRASMWHLLVVRAVQRVAWVSVWVGHWVRMRRVWVLRPQQLVAHLVRRLRRPLVVLVQVVRARQMWRRQLGWQQVQLWLLWVGLCRMWVVWQAKLR